MMRSFLFLSIFPASWLVVSCAEVSVADLGSLSRNAMNFDQQGAEFGECGVVSQFEKGRASSKQSAGGG
ncbi:MAG: hypothetical protein QNL33_20015 [Akkermansiaceae bacterium]